MKPRESARLLSRSRPQCLLLASRRKAS